jgi:dihydroneopterin aldolase
MSSDVIRLTGLRFHGHHGVFPEERENGQPFIVDLELRTSIAVAAASDDLADTIDYGAVAATVERIVTGPPRDLIETVTAEIADAVLADPRVASVKVSLHKPEAPIPLPFDDVVIEIERSRA